MTSSVIRILPILLIICPFSVPFLMTNQRQCPLMIAIK